MTRILGDADVERLMDRRAAVEILEAGFQADARGEISLYPRIRWDAAGVSVAWLAATLPRQDLLGFRAYLAGGDGSDRGEQVVALYRHSTMELRAVFLGRLLGRLRTGAAAVAALHLAQPDLGRLGLLGTGTQAREILACAVAALPLESVWAWSPDPGHRTEFRDWAEHTLRFPVHLATEASGVCRESEAVALATSATAPVLTAPMLPGPRLLLSISAYRRPELGSGILEAASRVWTDSVEQAAGSGTWFEPTDRRGKLRPLAAEADLGALRDGSTTRILINTGAAWEETLVGDVLYRAAEASGSGFSMDVTAPLGGGPEGWARPAR